MVRRVIYTGAILIIVNIVSAQQLYIDSLKQELSFVKNDTANLLLFGKIADEYSEINPDSAYYYGEKMLAITKKLDLKLEEVIALNQISYALLNKGNYPRSLQMLLSSISISEDPVSEKNILPAKYDPIDEFTDRTLTPKLQRLAKLSRTMQYAGILYVNAGNYEKAIYYYRASLPFAEQSNSLRLLSITYSTMGRSYLSLKQTDSALLYLQRSYDIAIKVGYNRFLGSTSLNLGRVYMAKGMPQKAKEYFRKGLIESIEHNYFRGVVASNLALADMYRQSGNADSSLYYIQNGLPVAYYLNAPDLLLRSYTALSEYYKNKGRNDSTVKYQSLIIKINDSLFNSKKTQEFQNIDFDDQQRQQQIEAAKDGYRNKIRIYLLLGGLAIFLLIAIMLWRNSQHRKKANTLLSSQKKELESALTTLQVTQKQLIQSEKMASLGELTAGIAHEIQNPLNFVNNFSEVNTELIDEMNEKLQSGKTNEAIALGEDVKQNNEKINFHGKRADSIVKGMLQHSRSSSGQKEATDINNLADECLRLSYHGMRAKDKSFNVKTETVFDNSIPLINIMPQDIGRVFLNLFTNAFYSVTQKKQQLGESYEPVISVKTDKTSEGVSITIRDNGNGIPQKALDKVFQPFFTTKPTGEGTGLGLSMSYDIITSGHNGELKVETKEGEYAEFIITLPL